MMLKPALRPPLRAPMRGATTLREGGGAPSWLPAAAFAGFSIADDAGYLAGASMSFDAWWTAVGGVYTRSGTKRYIDSDGLLKVAGANVWPVEYDPQTLERLGKSVWQATTPDNLWGRDLTNAVWTASNITPLKNQVGLDGVATSASLLTATANNGTILQAITDATARIRAMAAYVKRVTGTGTISITVDGGSTWTDVTDLVETGSFGRVQCWIGSLANPSFGFKLGTSGDAIVVDYAQLARDYSVGPPILTEGTVESISAEVAYVPVSGLPGWNASEGAAVALGRNLSIAQASRYMFAISNGSTGEVLLDVGSSFQARSAGTDQITVTGYSPAFHQNTFGTDRLRLRYGGRWKVNDYRVGGEGIISAVDASVTLAVGITRVYIGARGGGTNQYGGIIAGMAFANRYLDGDELRNFLASRNPIDTYGDSLSTGTAATKRRLGYDQRTRERVTRNRPRTIMPYGVGGTTSTQCKDAFLAETARTSWTHLFWTVHNDAPSIVAATSIANMQAIIAACTHDRWAFFTVLKVAADSGTIVTNKNAVNAWLRTNYSDHTIDALAYLQTKGDGGVADNNAIAADLVPPSLEDGVSIHLNDLGEKHVSDLLVAFLDAKGW